MKLSEEQIERASTVNLPHFLMQNGFDLKRVGREYVWKDHDSMHIKDNAPGERGVWHRFSTDEGGDNIAFLRQYMNMSFVEAVEALNGEHYDRTYTPPHTDTPKKTAEKEGVPEINEADNCKRVFAYLCKTRGLDYDLIVSLVKQGLISQEEKRGNVLFKFFDENGKVIGAEKVGTSTEYRFKGIAEHSAEGHGFEVVKGSGEKAFFFESAIDMLSYLQMHDNELDNCRMVSMMGLKPSIVFDTVLRYNIPPQNVFLCSDNDEKGNQFAERLMSEYPDMKRIVTPDTYKDWNDMLRGIPKKEIDTEQKTEVKKEADRMAAIGNEYWNSATDNRDKAVISMSVEDFSALFQKLEDSGLNYRAYRVASGFKMAVNAADVGTIRQLAGKNLEAAGSTVPFSPPEKNIIGNAEYRYIPNKEYISADRDLILKMAETLDKQGIKFSGRIYPTGKGTLTVSRNDLAYVRSVRDNIIGKRRQVGIGEKGQVIGNRSVSAQNRHLYMSTLTPKQYEEVKPFIETNARYSGVIRDGKVMFSVDRDEAQAFHRALDTAKREVGLIHIMQEQGLPMEQMIALSPVMHRLAVEDAQLQLSDFFDKRYDEAQFGEMLSLVNAYLDQPASERYGEHSKLNDMLEAKSSFDRTIELSDFFSQHDFSEEQKSAIATMFVGEVTRGQIDSIDETFTAEDIQEYAEILQSALQESDIADFLTSHKQAVIDRENTNRVPTEEEVLFPQANLARFLAEHTLSSDEWEDMAYPLFERGYLEKYPPSEKASFGYHLPEKELYALAERYHNGDDIRRELALGLMHQSGAEKIEFIFEDGELSSRTYFTGESLRKNFHVEYGEDSVKCTFGNAEREFTYEEMGQTFLDLIHEEFEDLAYWAVLDYIKQDIPDISDDTVKELITAFDGAALHGWENGDNQPKLNRIKKALFDVLGDEDKTEKAFACIAKHKYNVTFESEKAESSVHFGLLGNGITVYDVSRTDPETHDYPTVAHISAEGVVKIFDENISAEDMMRINEQAQAAREKFMRDWGKLSDVQQFQRLLDRADISTSLNINREQLSMEQTIEKYMPFVFFGEGERPEPISEAPETNRVHQLITNAGINGGVDDKSEYADIDEAIKAGRDYLADGYFGFSVFNQETLAIEHTEGDFPLSKAYNAEILKHNGINEPEYKGPVSLRKVGDFYEMFGKNAEIGAEVLGLRMLSKNGSPMVGFPDHIKDEYSKKLGEAGYTVLIEQAFELNPPKRDDALYYAEKHNLDVRNDMEEIPENLCHSLQDVVDRYFGTDCSAAETVDGTWRLAIAEGDKVSELFHNGEAVCGIYNRGDKMKIEPYLELSSFPKKLSDAMLIHNPDKLVEIMDFQRTFETPLDKAKWLINDFCEAEYREGADFGDLHNIGLAFTTLTDDELPIQVTADLVDFKITYEFDGEVYNTEQYDSIEDMIENGLTGLDFSDLVSVPDEVIERHTGKDEQTVDLMSDASDVKDVVSSADYAPSVTLKYKGDSESLDEIKDKALSLGAAVIIDNAEGIISIDTYENHTAELDGLAYELGIMRVDEAPAIKTEDIDDDAPLFSDADVIEQIQADEKADTPFWDMPVVQGEQLSLFGDPEPMTAAKAVPEKPKSEFANGPFVDGVQVYEALAAEIDRGTGFVHGKLRVQDFYEEKHPTVKELADYLKKEYGIGGHSGNDKISLVDYNSKGITFSFDNGEKFRHSWYNVATMTETRLRDDTYLSAEQKAERAALKAEQAEEQTSHIVAVGDRFRNKLSGEVSEVISLTGALPFYTDDCTIQRESDGFVISENISYDKLLNSGMYEYVGRAEQEKSQNETVKPEPEKVMEETPDKVDNFTITDDSLGEGGAKSKFRANVETIRTLKTLEAEKRPATADEKETLSRYVGWGAIPQAFDKSADKWSAEYKELSELLTPEEYRQARSTVGDAFYTSPTIIEGIYEALGNFGFEGGNVLEPAMGVGNFFGCMPKEMQDSSQLYGVEIDSISGRIAQALYPDADIAISGFEKNSFQNGCFDVAVGNVPFGELGFKDEKHSTTKLHDYFFMEAMDKVKNGGIVAFVTSAGTLDKHDESTRQMLADKADLIGAIRLPGGKNGAFHDNAGTDVTTDIIFLQKREGKSVAELSDIPDWVHIGETADGLPINQYFADNPDMVLGKVVEGNKLYGSGTMVVAEDGFDLKSALHEAISRLSAEISRDKARDVYAKTEQGLAVKIPSDLRNFSFFMQDDAIYFKKNAVSFEQRFDKKNAQFSRYKAFIELRDITRELIQAQELNKPDSVIADLQAKLNASYDDFYKKYGLIHSKTNKRYFNEDISYNLVAGLEKKIDKDKLVEKSDIFTKRTICPPKAVECVETAMEALTLSIAEKARVDFEYMSMLTGLTEGELKHDLVGEIYKIPHTENTYQTASEYLSGDIRAKLREAEEVAEYDADFNINVNALQKAMPEPLKAGDIDVKIGATWLDPKYYNQFMYELLGTPDNNRADKPQSRWFKHSLIQAEYSEHSNSWHIANKKADRSVLVNQKYGSGKMNAYEIMEHLLNLKEPKVYKTIEVPDGLGDTKEKRVIDEEATRVVQKKAKEIKKAFKAWIFKDAERREAIVDRYNELFNSIRPREFDGSALSFPMMNSSIHLHDHQRNAIAHAMFGGNTLFAHSVGAGKTFEMIATAMESKRLGLCTKSLFAVPNHLTEQIGDDFMKLYPGANILVATKKDFQKANRQQLFAKIATGNYDAVIIGHSQLGMIPMSRERQEMVIQSQIDDILEGIEELKRSEGSKFQIKAMEKTRKSLQKQLDRLEKVNQDGTITFEQLGVDKLFVDEAHEFKNLFTPTKLTNVAGISNSASQKALDLFLKCRYLDEKTGGKGVVFATGTPYASPYQH